MCQGLAESLAKGLDIQFGCLVNRVEWSAAGVKIICEDGQTFNCDAAVVTVSLGVLKVSSIGYGSLSHVRSLHGHTTAANFIIISWACMLAGQTRDIVQSCTASSKDCSDSEDGDGMREQGVRYLNRDRCGVAPTAER